MGEIITADRGGRGHGEVLGQFHPDCGSGVQQFEKGGLFAVVRAGGISGSRPDTGVFFLDQFVDTQIFLACVTPELAPYPQVQMFGEGFRQPVRQRLQQNAVVIIVLRFKGVDPLLLTDTGSHHKAANKIRCR